MGSSSSSQTRVTVDSNGAETDESKTYTRDSDGLHVRSDAQTVTPDGSARTTFHDEQTASPDGETISHTTTTTEH
jgi:hypothetical protein